MNLTASEIFNRYRNAQQNQQIATEFSFFSLAQILAVVHPRSILELGGGIGTMTELCCSDENRNVATFEHNDYCLNQLHILSESYKNLNIYSDYSLALEAAQNVEFLVCDVNTSIFSTYWLVKKSHFKYIFVEGHQVHQRARIVWALFQNGRSYSYIDLRPGEGQKGCLLIVVDDSRSKLEAIRSFKFSVVASALVIKAGGAVLPHLGSHSSWVAKRLARALKLTRFY